MDRRQKLIFAGIIVFLAGGLALAAYLVRQITNQPPRAAAGLFLNMSATEQDNNEIIVSVIANPQDTSLRNVAAMISYNPNAIEILEVSPGQSVPFNEWTYFSTTDVTENNFVELIAGRTNPDAPALTQSAILGTIRVRLKTDEPTTLSFLTGEAESGGIDIEGNEVALQTNPLVLNKQSTINQARLKLQPERGDFPVDPESNLSIDIILDTGGNPVYGATAILAYDKSRLRFTGIKEGVFDKYNKPNGSNSYLNPEGQIELHGFIDNTDNPVNGSSVKVATLEFLALEPGEAEISFVCTQPAGETDPKVCDPNADTGSLVSLATPQGEGDNILSGVSNGNYTLKPSPTATTAPNTPTPTPSPTAIPEPTLTPTPIPTSPPIPTATPKSEPTAGQQPQKAGIKLSLNACSEKDNLSRPVYLQIGKGEIKTLQNMDAKGNIPNAFIIPNSSVFKITVMPEGHLPLTISVKRNELLQNNNLLDLTSTPFIGGNTQTVTDTNTGVRDLSKQRINSLDFSVFFNDFGKTIAENPEAVRSDSNCSGTINVLDYSSILIHWGKTKSD